METIAIISDIHANLVALEAVLDDLDGVRPDRVVCLGDVAATGPQPAGVIDRLRPLGWSFVRGNCDDALLRFAAGAGKTPADAHDEIDLWCARQLSPEALAFLASFEPVVTLSTGHGQLCCYHGSPHSNLDEIHPGTGEEELGRWMRGQPARLFAGGHTHVQMLRSYHGAYLINPGSAGLPYAIRPDGDAYYPAWAEYAVVRVSASALSVELKRVSVDLTAVLEAARSSGMPRLDWWSEGLESVVP